MSAPTVPARQVLSGDDGVAYDAALSSMLPRPRMTWRGVGLAALLWLVYAVLYSLVIASGVGVALLYVLPGQLFLTLLLALFSIPVWLLVIRAMDALGWGWKIAVHLVVGPFYAWAGLKGYLLFLVVFVDASAADQIGESGQWITFSNLTAYVIQFALYHTIRSVQRLQIREQQAMELKALAQEQALAALKAQVNPHFLFNTLNSISAMVTQDPHESREMIARLAEMLRYALDSAKRDLVPLGQEVDFARAYLDLEAHRFSDRLRVHYQIDPAALDVQVPPVVLQPLLENAVKHGIGPSENGGAISLRIAAEDGRLAVSVEDTGVGLNGQAPDDGRGGIGLTNTEARLCHVFGPGAALHTETLTPHGFKVWFEVPYEL